MMNQNRHIAIFNWSTLRSVCLMLLVIAMQFGCASSQPKKDEIKDTKS